MIIPNVPRIFCEICKLYNCDPHVCASLCNHLHNWLPGSPPQPLLTVLVPSQTSAPHSQAGQRFNDLKLICCENIRSCVSLSFGCCIFIDDKYTPVKPFRFPFFVLHFKIIELFYFFFFRFKLHL